MDRAGNAKKATQLKKPMKHLLMQSQKLSTGPICRATGRKDARLFYTVRPVNSQVVSGSESSSMFLTLLWKKQNSGA
jgi:4-hydroxy-3-methylbut-2-enyl diphosphate reductase IspH